MRAVKPVSLEDLKNLAEVIPVPLVVLNGTGALYVNDHFRRLTGYCSEELDAVNMLQIIHPEQQEGFLRNMTRILNHQPSDSQRDLQIHTKDGQVLWVDYQYSVVTCEDQRWVVASLSDITTKKLNQQDLRRLVKLRESMLEITQSIIGVTHMDYIYALVLEKAINAIEAAEVGSIMLREGPLLKVVAHHGFVSDSVSSFQLPVHKSFLYKATRGKLDRIAKIDNLESLKDVYFIPLEENSTRMIKSAITAPITINGNFFGVVNVDATEIGAFTDDDLKVMQFIRDNVEIAITNHLLQEEKHILSQYDSLTGLYNRTIFEEIFEQVLEKSKRYDETFQLVLIDLNGLKVLNDRLGHTAGDQLIKQFGNTLKKITRKSDVLGRYGGDEFVAVFHYARREDLHGKLRDLLQFLEEHPFCIEGTSCTCSFSYGIATFGDDGLSLKELVQVADRRMYEFKEAYKSSHLNQHLRVISSTL